MKVRPEELQNGNRMESPPIASRGRMNSVMFVMVGPDHDVEWIIDHNNLGQAVTGYRLVEKKKGTADGTADRAANG
jgi:hypothetical protein